MTRDEARERIVELRSQRVVLAEYLRMCIDTEDWHGVQDAGSDLRELDREVAVLRQMVRGDAAE